ncbi:MAG: hypothetical protein AAF242_07100 [Bacteroidota bacterium]
MINLKQSFFIALFLLSIVQLSAQSISEGAALKVSYWGQSAYQPGAKVALELPHRAWQTDRRNKHLFSSYQVAFYTNPGIEQGYLTGAELGIKSSPQDKSRFQAFSVGAAYLLKSDIIGFSVDLATGESSNTDRQINHIFLPTINYELGNQLSERMNWFSKLSLGSKLSSQSGSELVFFLELGLQFSL